MSYDYILKMNGKIIKEKNIQFKPNVIAEMVEDLLNLHREIKSLEMQVYVCTGKGDKRNRK